MEILLQHTGGARFVAEARQHRLILDQPAEDGATDQGMSPAELLLASLGGSVGQNVAQYLRLRGISAEGLSVQVAAQPASRPLRLRDFTVQVAVPGLTDRQLRALEKSLLAGLVQNAICLENSVRVTAASAGPAEKSPRKAK